MLTRRRAAVAGAVILALVVLFVLWRRGGDSDRSERKKPASARTDGGKGARGTGAGAGKLVLDGELPAPALPIIDEIIVEKQEVCEGEENLITVRAHTPEGVDDAYLHYLILDGTGASVPLRLTAPSPEDTIDSRTITVFGRENVAVTVPLPKYTIRRCQPTRKLLLTRRVMANTEAEFEFTARIDDLGGTAPLKRPIRYRWDFGDGEIVETDVPVAVHDFSERPQDTLYSHILVGCTATGADGEKVFGRNALQLYNVAFEELHSRGVVRLMVMLTPRFPLMEDDGVVEQRARIWHWHDSPVTVERIEAVHITRAGKERSEEADVDEVLGTARIPPSGIDAKVFIDTRADPDLAMINYYLEGSTQEGLRAAGSFSIMRPPDRPTRDNSTPVTSALMRAKIKRAMELTGKDVVNDEDLWRLEKEGKFADLKAEDFPPDPPQPEPVRPGTVGGAGPR
jgi:hypothetical protein